MLADDVTVRARVPPTHVGDGDGLVGLVGKIVEQVLDEDAALSDLTLWLGVSS